jgi:tetratricopeptide (TPR) repeat protein
MTKRKSALPFDAAIDAAQQHVDLNRWNAAVVALEQAVAVRPDAEGAWRGLGDARRAAGDPTGASMAHERAAQLALARLPLRNAVTAINTGRLASAERIVRARLAAVPTDIAAIVLLADLALRAGKPADAVRFLRRALEIAPDFVQARTNLARILYDNRNLPEALAEFDQLLAAHPKHLGYLNTRAAILDQFGDHEAAATEYRKMLAYDPTQPLVWMTLGNVLKTIGDISGAMGAFRRSLALAPDTGESWWGLANLKSFRFEANDIGAMEKVLSWGTLTEVSRICVEFALGKAFEDARCYMESFSQ